MRLAAADAHLAIGTETLVERKLLAPQEVDGLFGGIREAAQVVSYGVPRAMCVLVPVIIAGTLNLYTISHLQAGWLPNWYLFHDPFTFAAFWIFFTCATASCKRAPFDLAEAETELLSA